MKLLNFFKSKSFLINLLIALVITILLIVGVVKSLHFITNQDQKIEVPNLRGLTLEEVEIVLDDLKLKYEVLETGSYNPEIPKEAVLEQEPAVGAIVKEKRKIYVIINPDGYSLSPVPVFYGKTKKEIVQLIVNSGFTVGDYQEINDIGTVVRKLKHKGQPLSAGDMLPKMSTIDVVIGNGELR